ncbi:MAG TPA: zinc ribbon domain-containing protein [Symbiobacteriaceae bacterium]|nr:zinc ribbon domain-containing protein [Symbiobacteriaceae bacterium]
MDELIKFTRNHNDLSTDRGYQFDFFCDICGNSYRSPYQASVAGTVGEVLRGVGSLFGGVLGRVGDASYDMQRAVGGKAHDDAFRSAVESVMPHFMQCSRCGKWVCKEVCWNDRRGLCVDCAPKLEQEMAAYQSEAQLEQVREKVRATDYSRDVNVVDQVVAKCPNCGAETMGGKFCLECGTPVVK